MLESNGVLRGGKRDLYEGGIRVPLIARWPAGVPAGRVTDHASAFWDFMPTACELLGIGSPPGIDGISFAATLTGKGVQTAHPFLYWEFHELDGRRALRKGGWKLVQYGLKPGNFGKCQLYNLTEDLPEKNDLAAKHPERVAGMLEEMNAARTRSQRFPHPGLDALGK